MVRLRRRENSELPSAPPVEFRVDRREFTGRGELFLAVLADRLQRAVAGRCPAVDHEQAVVGEVGQPVGDGHAVTMWRGDGVHGGDVEPGREHRYMT